MKLAVYEETGMQDDDSNSFLPFQDVSFTNHGSPRIQDNDDVLSEIIDTEDADEEGLFL